MKRFVTGKKDSSTRWLTRQASDPYVQAAKAKNYRSRAAFKLLEIDDKVKFLKAGRRVVDLGAAPGGWTQVAVERAGQGHVVAIDILPMEPVAGAEILLGDFLALETLARLQAALRGPIDTVLSDMRTSTTGHRETDHLRTMALVEAAAEFAAEVLRPGGTFVAKMVQGGGEGDLMARLKREYAVVRRIKPPASRSESAEFYVVATGYRGKG